MPYEDKIMVASGDSEHPGEEEVGFETPTRRTGGGHTYDLEFNDGLDELTLTEDSSDKTTLPLAATFVGTEAEWNALSAAEKANYRLVNFTDDGGIGDASNAVVAFTSSDVADGNVNDWTSVTPIVTGLNLKTLWERASMMFKNVRYLFKMLGTTDISSIGNGTVTGAISTTNTNLGNKVNISDIKNNLTSTDTNKPLSAAQGKVLNDAVAQLSSNLIKNISHVYIRGTSNTSNKTVKIIVKDQNQVEQMFVIFTAVTNNTTAGLRIIKGNINSSLTTTRISGGEGNAILNSDKSITVPHDDWAFFIILGTWEFDISIS